MKFRIMTLVLALLMIGTTVFGMVACADKNGGKDTGTESESTLDTDADTDTAAGTETETDAVPEPDTRPDWMTEVNMSSLNELMQPIFMGNTVKNETVMFIDRGDTKELLYPISEIVSVTSYDYSTTYEEGRDYVITDDGKLMVPDTTTIPIITSEVYYNDADSLITVNGHKIFWGEGAIQPYQVNVTYTHESTWDGYAQDCAVDVYEDFIKKLQNGEDVTVFFYGDSITYGSNASWLDNNMPTKNQYPYSILFTEALADLYGYTVHYEDYVGKLSASSGLTGVPKVPTEDYVAGTNGTITYINTSEGGEGSAHAGDATKMESYVLNPIREHGCDLFVVAYGMNDGGSANINRAIQNILEQVWTVAPDTATVIVSTMMPHNNSDWDAQQKNQEANLATLVAQLKIRQGKAVALACVNSVSKAILEKKTFNDYTGNNINHPNDFFTRVYAQVLLQTVIGYENME